MDFDAQQGAVGRPVPEDARDQPNLAAGIHGLKTTGPGIEAPLKYSGA
jgi:hypothetical protein